MRRSESVINLDPIDRRNKKRKGVIGRLFITKRFRGKPMKKTDPYGHYLFVGRQRAGKTTSMLWFAEHLRDRYEHKKKRVVFYSNMGFGIPITKLSIASIIESLRYDFSVVHIFCLDELQSYFPKDTKDMDTLKLIDKLTGEFSQLGKRQIYVLSSAQIYGRVNKNLREQCLYMVNCRRSRLTGKCVNDFIAGEDILCDDLGRWSGDAEFIYVHGLPKMDFDTHRLILE